MTLFELRKKIADELTLSFTQDSLLNQQLHSVPLDADLILAHFLGKDRTWIMFHRDFKVEDELLQQILKAVEKRKTGFPVAYITNHKEFFGLDFYVDENVLIPKPDSEILIENALQLQNNSQLTVCDMCCGSGCIGISFLNEVQKKVESGVWKAENGENNSQSSIFNTQLSLTFADISAAALKIAEMNFERICAQNASAYGAALSTAERSAFGEDERERTAEHATAKPGRPFTAKFIQSNLFENIPEEFDLILTNPPYVPHSQSVELLQDGRSEPLLALDGDVTEGGTYSGTDDGLFLIKRLVPQCFSHLKAGGRCIMETGEYNAEQTAELFKAAGFTEVCMEKDLNGMLRNVLGKKPEI